MMTGVYPGVIFTFLYVVAAIFMLLWPLLIWSHLREQTRYLRQIRDILRSR